MAAPRLFVSGFVIAFAMTTAGAGAVGCRDTDRFSSRGDRFEGPVVKGSFVRSGIAEDVQMCMTFDTEHLQDNPGTISSTDGRFHNTPLRPIPQIWHDPLSTLSFGDGRIQNLVYAAAPAPGDVPADGQDVLVVISLMQGDNIEVRLVRGAPQTGGTPPGVGSAIFGVFTLERRGGPCVF